MKKIFLIKKFILSVTQLLLLLLSIYLNSVYIYIYTNTIYKCKPQHWLGLFKPNI